MYLPLVAYAMLCVMTPSRQKRQIPERRHAILDARMSGNLNLLGISFAVVSLLVSLSKDDIHLASAPIFKFSLSAACFFASYIILHFRRIRLFDTASDGLSNSGIFAVLFGLKDLFDSYKLDDSSVLFSAVLTLSLLYIALDVTLKWKNRKEIN
ncbi:hypothetical protein ACU5P1_10490 [Pseudomonas plecoglossicida]|uniref:hypothetical protein n=1 Tax=Pseudomonas plecoglossicida TaxID=70775 RepID=UPI00118435C5|nr:hypothetical protein [Pseudomonas plecoglossicida]QLB55218.1 hypothetical protein HAV28_10415 [Pseudomonas plecoglossicida]